MSNHGGKPNLKKPRSNLTRKVLGWSLAAFSGGVAFDVGVRYVLKPVHDADAPAITEEQGRTDSQPQQTLEKVDKNSALQAFADKIAAGEDYQHAKHEMKESYAEIKKEFAKDVDINADTGGMEIIVAQNGVMMVFVVRGIEQGEPVVAAYRMDPLKKQALSKDTRAGTSAPKGSAEEARLYNDVENSVHFLPTAQAPSSDRTI